MKLNNILEAGDPLDAENAIETGTMSYPKGAWDLPNSKFSQLGHAGVQGYAYKHPKQSNVAVKKAYTGKPDKDAYVQFIKLALKHQDNPFFPKIYSAKLYHRPHSKHLYRKYELIVTMERLHSIKDEKLIDIALQNFALVGVKFDSVYDIVDWFDKRKNRVMLARRTKNPKFREALRLLEPYFRRYGVPDLHSGNWMFRLTGTGPQLVMLDPIVGSA